MALHTMSAERFTPPTTPRLVALLLLSGFMACGDDPAPAGRDTALADTSSDTAEVLADVGGDTTAGVPCFEGTWRLFALFCNDLDVTNNVATEGGLESMVVAFTALDGGRCEVVATASGPTCTEVSRAQFMLSAGGDLQSTSEGIIACNPEACAFNAQDAPCVLGDRANEAPPASLTLTAGVLEIVHQAPDGICGRFGQTTTAHYRKGE